VAITTFHTPPVLDWGLLVHATYFVSPGRGTLTLLVHVSTLHTPPHGTFPPKHIPRIGLNLRLSKALDKVDCKFKLGLLIKKEVR
jgi:beta-galactosidase